MKTYAIDTTGNFMGCYDGETPAQALDAYARDAGYCDYARVVELFGDDAESFEIDTLAICTAVTEYTGFAVFQDSYGNGVALIDNKSYESWDDVAAYINKNVLWFKR